jgi:hypothetical protein
VRADHCGQAEDAGCLRGRKFVEIVMDAKRSSDDRRQEARSVDSFSQPSSGTQRASGT